LLTINPSSGYNKSSQALPSNSLVKHGTNKFEKKLNYVQVVEIRKKKKHANISGYYYHKCNFDITTDAAKFSEKLTNQA
jgi:hypothetical protein